MIGHDLRAPFNALLGLAEILSSEAGTMPTQRIEELATDLWTASRQAFTLVENLLEWASVESGLIRPRPIPIKLDQMALSVISVLSKLAEKKAITLTVVPNTAVILDADQHMMYSVLQNLLTNAIKFTLPGGSVTVSSQVKASVVTVAIADTGVGMNQAQLDNLWHMNKAAVTQGTAGEKGTGLGLLLCKRFIELNGGELDVTSQAGKGTTFTFTVPGCQPVEKTPPDT